MILDDYKAYIKSHNTDEVIELRRVLRMIETRRFILSTSKKDAMNRYKYGWEYVFNNDRYLNNLYLKADWLAGAIYPQKS